MVLYEVRCSSQDLIGGLVMHAFEAISAYVYVSLVNSAFVRRITDKMPLRLNVTFIFSKDWK